MQNRKTHHFWPFQAKPSSKSLESRRFRFQCVGPRLCRRLGRRFRECEPSPQLPAPPSTPMHRSALFSSNSVIQSGEGCFKQNLSLQRFGPTPPPPHPIFEFALQNSKKTSPNGLKPEPCIQKLARNRTNQSGNWC